MEHSALDNLDIQPEDGENNLFSNETILLVFGHSVVGMCGSTYSSTYFG